MPEKGSEKTQEDLYTHTHTHRANPGKEENLISRVTTFLNSNVQFSTTTTTKSQSIERNRQVWHIKKNH